MPTWEDLAEAANTQIFAVFGETVSYSRPGNSTLDPLATFETVVIPHQGIEFQGPNAPTHALEVKVADIPSYPQRGDLIVRGGITYSVHQMIPPAPPYTDGTAILGIRKI